MGKRNAAKRMKQGAEVNLSTWFDDDARMRGPQLHAIEGGRGWHPDDATPAGKMTKPMPIGHSGTRKM